ncbi:MAG: hypothetical protein II877_06820 [Synergistaceae bacterium]|nr:hypothetical protein [Synergistaceae bacterium]
MPCLSCSESPAEYSFRVLEIHTLHVRDFDGERLIQSLGEERVFSVCSACVSSEMRAVLFPAVRILKGSAGFGVLILAGLVMTLTLSLNAELMGAIRIIGPLAVLTGISGIFGRAREILAQRKILAGLSENEARKYSAWQCVINNAPQKYNDNDITYIPVDDAMSLSPDELAVKYGLLPAISRKAYEVIHKE